MRCGLVVARLNTPVHKHFRVRNLSFIIRQSQSMSTRRSARLSAAAESDNAPSSKVIEAESLVKGPSKRAKASAAIKQIPKAKTAANGTTAGKRKGKTAAVDDDDDEAQTSRDEANRAAMPPPATPQPAKRRKTGNAASSPAQPAPLTPTPSAVGIMASGQSSTPSNTSKRRAARLVDPHATNALLRTPTGTRVITNPDASTTPAAGKSSGLTNGVNGAMAATTKDVVSLNFPKATTETLLKDACAHLCKMDETGRLAKVIEQNQCGMFTPEGLQEEINPFASLASSIIAQQVSGAAATSIKNKFLALFPAPRGDVEPLPKTHFPTPAAVAAKPIEELRSAGLSQRKAEYIHGLAEKFRDGELSSEMLASASDEEVMEKLVAVRGLGRWSVEMFACFALKRLDVFSAGDLGVQRGMASYVGRDVAKLKNKGGKWKYMSEAEMVEISDRFRPYRTLFMWYMWRFTEDSATDVKAISGD